jgi:regulator of nucleoside diphosphate kinase
MHLTDEQRALCVWENEGGAKRRASAPEVTMRFRKEAVVRTRLYEAEHERGITIRPQDKSRGDFGETLPTAGEAVFRIAGLDPQRRAPVLPNGDTLITDADRRRLRVVLRRLSDSGRGRRQHLSSLRRRLERAEIVTPTEIPRNVVTLNSRLVLKDLDSRGRLVCTLAEPWDRSPPGDRISVSGPAGTALLGSRVGQIVRWRIGARDRRFRIEQILYQPEAAGDFHL